MKFLLLVASVVVSLAFGSAAQQPTSSSFESTRRARIDAAIDAVYPSLVRIAVVTEEGMGGRMRKQRATGSGAIISEEGHVLTNHHVAGKATRIICRLSNREEVEAELIGTDILSDLAVIKLDLSSRKPGAPSLAVAKLGDSSTVEVGDTVLAMGSPAGLSQSVTLGIVSNTEMIPPSTMRFTLDGENVGQLVRWIGHDAIIFGGNSGGPLVNLDGEVIGVNEVSVGSLGGAIPSNLARQVAADLIEHGYVRRSWVGILSQPLLKRQADETGILVGGTVEDSPAKRAGLRAGDIIRKFNGKEVDARSNEEIPPFNAMIFNVPVGEEISLEGTRGGEAMTWTVKTDEREATVDQPKELKNWGITARDITRLAALSLGRPDKKGVFVHSVLPGGPAKEARPEIRPGDVVLKVGHEEVANTDALKVRTATLLEGKDGPQPLLVQFERKGREYLTVAKVGPDKENAKPRQSRKAWLGIETQVLSRDLAEVLGLKGKKGVRVTRVHPDTTAGKAGLQVGDVLLKLDGMVINAHRPEDDGVLGNLIRQYDSDAEVEFLLHRNGETIKLTTALEQRPPSASELDEYDDKDFEFTVRELSFHDRVNLRIDGETGVLVSRVANSGWAALAGLRSGDVVLKVEDQEVPDIDAFKNTLEKIKEGKPRQIVLFIKRGINTLFREVEPKWE